LIHKDSTGVGSKEVEQNYSVSFLPYVLIGIVLGAIADFLPGVSTPAQLAVFGSLLDKNMSTRNFIAHVAAIDASHTIFSIASASTIGIARVGVVAIASKAYEFNPENMVLFIGVFICALGVGVLFLLKVGGAVEKFFKEVKFEPIAKILCLYLFLLAFIFGGFYGVLVMIVAALIGFLPIFFGVSRTHVMGSIILASILRAFVG